jgi:tetratricopeptide (TPR) repeat protein
VRSVAPIQDPTKPNPRASRGLILGVLIPSLVSLGAATVVGASPAGAAGGYGHVEFANSGSPAAQADFQDGMAMLHDFEYPSAAAAFRRAQAADPGFAMAYWGEAMTHNHPIWKQQDLGAARAALNKLAPTASERRAKAKTDREKMYMDAVAILYGDGTKEERDFRYEAAMKALHERYPDDVDAFAFYGLAILGTAHAGRDVAIYMRAAGVLEEAWMDHREHPGLVHYLIHCYDDPDHAPLGLRAARIYARIAPDAGHAQHMVAHIFLPLGMWPEAANANVLAIAAVDRQRAAAGRPPLCCGHYPSWLGYVYLQLGEINKARAALDTCHASLSPEEKPSMSMDPDDSDVASFANMLLRYLLDSGDWSGEPARWPLPHNAGLGARLDYTFARAMGEIAQNQLAAARRTLRDLETIGREVADTETKGGAADPTYRVRPEILLLEARGLLAERERDYAKAEELLRQAVALEETLPIAFGPPTIDKPTHELLGEYLLRRDRMTEARSQFEMALARTPGRRLAEQGLEAASAPQSRPEGANSR